MDGAALLAAGMLLVPFAGAGLILAARLVGREGRWPATVGLASGLLTAGLALALAATLSRTAEPLLWRTAWLPEWGIGVGVYVDDLALLFAVLIAGVSALTLLYSQRFLPRYLALRELRGGEAAYYGVLLLFTGGMLALVCAADFLQLYFFWELTSLASFLLIALDWRAARARAAGVKALLVTGFGGLALLLAVVLIGRTAGTFALPEALAAGEALRAAALLPPALLLVVFAAASKSAQFPLHVWLPGAMVAPTPVSAFLHSAALVAAGVFLLARLQPLFGGEPLWQATLIAAGLASALVGGVLALRETDLKGVLAYSTIAQYGFMFVLLGLPGETARAAALFTFLQHGIAKAALFFVVGAVVYATGRGEIGRGVRLPAVLAVAAALALSLGGLPPLAGFWLEEAFLAAALPALGPLPLALALAASALTLAYMLRFLVGAFSGGEPLPEPPRPLPAGMLLPPALLAGLTVLFGLRPELAGALVATEPLDLAYHVDLRFALSLLALAAGAALFLTHGAWSAPFFRALPEGWSADRLYLRAGGATRALAAQAGRLQNGSLPRYLWGCLLGLGGLALFALPGIGWDALPAPTGGGLPVHGNLADAALALALLLIGAGTLLTFTMERHLQVVLALGVVGYLLAAVFALLLAPDVGLVQAHVETLVTVLFVLALTNIPRAVRRALVLPARARLGAARLALATTAGLASAAVSWAAIEHLPAEPVGPWLAENAAPLTRATDAVAAVLVHFRALDTLGEVTVFATAGLGVALIVRLIRGEAE